MASEAQASCEVHVVCIPSPFQSHIKAMLKLAKLLHHKGSHITFVNTEFNHRRFLQSRGAQSSDGFRNFQFATIPDGLPQQDNTTGQDILSLSESIKNGVLLEPFRHLLAKLMNDYNHSAQTSWMIISGGFMPFTTTVAEEFGLPVILFFTISACSLMGFKQFGTLKQKGITLENDERYLTKEYLDTVIDWILGLNA